MITKDNTIITLQCKFSNFPGKCLFFIILILQLLLNNH